MPAQPASFGDWLFLPEVAQINADALAESQQYPENQRTDIYSRILRDAYNDYLATFE